MGFSNFLSPVNIGIAEILIPFLTIGAAGLVRQDTWQRVWAAKSLKTTVNSYWLAAAVMFITGAMIIFIGVFANAGLGINIDQPQMIYYEVIFGSLPFWFAAVMFIVLIATILSCADSFFIAVSTLIVNDILKPMMKEQSDEKKLSRLMVLVMSVFSLILAFAIPRLVELWLTGSAIIVAGLFALFAPISLGLLWEKPNNIAGITSMWTGIIVTLVWQFAGHPYGIHPVFIGFPLSLIVLLGLTFVPVNSKVEKAIELSTK